MKFTKKGIWDFVFVMIIFTCTGTTSVFVSAVIMNSLEFEKWSAGYILGYIFIILPLYHVILLVYAFIFGRFDLFYSKVKKIVSLVGRIFSRSRP